MKPEPDRDPLDEINRATARLLRLNASRSAFARSAAAAGVELTHPAYLLLRAIAERGPMPISSLAGLVTMDPGTAARQVTKLVQAGLAERREDAADGRVSLVAVTRRGAAAARSLTDIRTHHLSASVQHWSERDLATFARLLTRFVDDMAATSY
jgi:DNA-binding MarR family transcriptional regulator